jgi:hypothetical protein
MQQQLAIELAALVLDSLAPEELPLLGETADEYFADSSAVLDPARRDEALGFGLSVDLLSPYVLAVVTPVVHFLLTAVADAMKQEARPRVEEFVRRLFRRHREPDRVETIGLKPDQARHLREITIARARAVGVAESRAALLADAIVGSLVVSG